VHDGEPEHILRKLGVHSRAQAVSVAVRDETLLADSSSPHVEASSLARR
jgi:hypothetical protein